MTGYFSKHSTLKSNFIGGLWYAQPVNLTSKLNFDLWVKAGVPALVTHVYKDFLKDSGVTQVCVDVINRIEKGMDLDKLVPYIIKKHADENKKVKKHTRPWVSTWSEICDRYLKGDMVALYGYHEVLKFRHYRVTPTRGAWLHRVEIELTETSTSMEFGVFHEYVLEYLALQSLRLELIAADAALVRTLEKWGRIKSYGCF